MSDTTARDPGEDALVEWLAEKAACELGDSRGLITDYEPKTIARWAARAVRAHDARRPAGDAVERIAEAMWEDKEQDNQREWDTHAVFEAVSTPWMEAPDRERVWWRQKARAAIAALPGDTLEGLLSGWMNASAVIVKHSPGMDGSPVKHAIRASLSTPDREAAIYGEGVELSDAIRAALAAGEGQGDGDER